MAHVFAANNSGPRANRELTAVERGAYENIILLCANCHTLVDKTPNDHPVELMNDWKNKHIARVRSIFEIEFYSNRNDLFKTIGALLRKTRIIHLETGPDLDYRFDPEASEARVWQAKVIHEIIPTNQKIIQILDLTIDLLAEDEKIIVEKFRMHVNGQILRHIEEQNVSNIRFPSEMNLFGA